MWLLLRSARTARHGSRSRRARRRAGCYSPGPPRITQPAAGRDGVEEAVDERGLGGVQLGPCPLGREPLHAVDLREASICFDLAATPSRIGCSTAPRVEVAGHRPDNHTLPAAWRTSPRLIRSDEGGPGRAPRVFPRRGRESSSPAVLTFWHGPDTFVAPGEQRPPDDR